MNQDKSILKAKVILMAEDDADDRLLARDALAECGLGEDLRFVDNGEELLASLIQRGNFDAHTPQPGLILLDLNMPVKDGREVLQEIKSHA